MGKSEAELVECSGGFFGVDGWGLVVLFFLGGGVSGGLRLFSGNSGRS